jgi:hypothetical protein
MSLILAILSLLTALLPIADRSIQGYQHYQQGKQAAPAEAVRAALQPVVPPEAGQANVVFYNGEWWKYENGAWLVWRPNRQYMAQGGVSNVSR